jgi:hypothetical protein
VFSSKRLAGNSRAVVFDADGLDLRSRPDVAAMNPPMRGYDFRCGTERTSGVAGL